MGKFDIFEEISPSKVVTGLPRKLYKAGLFGAFFGKMGTSVI
jgi:hypothetical protein